MASVRERQTTSRTVRAILEAPGAVLRRRTSATTSSTSPERSVQQHGPVWVYDSQEIAVGSPAWWWNPLSYATNEAHDRQAVTTLALGRSTQSQQRRPPGDRASDCLADAGWSA